MRASVLASVLFVVLCGCSSTGVKVSEEQAQQFKVGVSTYADVVAALGQPTTVTSSTGGMRIATYSYASFRSQPQNFIPYLGPLVAGYDTQSSAVVFTFDQRGILTDTQSTQTGMGTGANLAAGANAATRPYQAPR